MPNKFRAYVAGYRAGKTWAGSMAQCIHAYEYPGVNQGYFAPTYPMIRDIYYPTIEEVASAFGLRTVVKEGNHEVEFYSGRRYRGTTICRSMENPENIIGFAIGNALVDEIDTLPINKADRAWGKIIARMSIKRDDLRNGIDVCTTPEGFRFAHKTFVRRPQENPALAKNYGLIQASTYENEKNLPDDYIATLLEAYPSELIEAYLNGQFVNLTSGTVYRNYDRVRCNSTETIRPGEPLFIGMDFNVQHMAASIHVQRPTGWHRIAELKDVFDTPEMIRIVGGRWKSKGHRIVVYPDASGKSRKSVDASKTDIALLEDAGFGVRVGADNPPVRDRVNAMNKAFEQGRYFINSASCPWSVECLEQQAYNDNGEPDKTTGHDHMNDGAGYFVAYEMPIARPFNTMSLAGC
jgi:hypothetical protein